MMLSNPFSTARRLDPRSMIRRGRASAEAIAREKIPHVAMPHVVMPHVTMPRFEVAPAPRRRGLAMIIILAVLMLVAAMVAYLIWQRRDHEHAQLVTEPDRPDETPASPSEPDASPSATPDEPVAEPSVASPFTPPAAEDGEGDDGDEPDEDAPEPEPETAPPAREPVTARGTVASAELAPSSSPRATDLVQRRVERRLRMPGATATAMPGGGINLPAARPGTPPRA